MKNQKVNEILHRWLVEGEEDHTTEDGQLIPKCPEFVYRLSGEWKGWSDFLGVDFSSEAYKDNEYRDQLEDQAFALFRSRHH